MGDGIAALPSRWESADNATASYFRFPKIDDVSAHVFQSVQTSDKVAGVPSISRQAQTRLTSLDGTH